MNIRKFIESKCANYDSDGLCLLNTTPNTRVCPYFSDGKRACNYAEQSVIPDSSIEATYNASRGKAGGGGVYCKSCGKPYTRKSNRQKYCAPCGADRRRKQKRRQNQRYYERKRTNIKGH